MDLRNSHALRIPEDLQGLLFPSNLMEPCAVPPIILSIWHSRRLERNGSLRLVYAARIGHCRSCPLREQCQGHGSRTVKPRRVSAVFQPLSSSPVLPGESLPPSVEPPSLPDEPVPPSVELLSLPDEPIPASVEPASLPDQPAPPSTEPPSRPVESVSPSIEPSSLPDEPIPASVEPVSVSAERVLPSIELPSSPTPCPVLWEDWPTRSIRRKWINLLRTETVLLTMGPALTEKITDSTEQNVLTRAQRAHWRLSWSQRLARNARGATAPPLEITLHGLPASTASALALDIAAAA